MANILFDFDGTLADSLNIVRELLIDIAPYYNLPIPDDALFEEWRKLTLQELMTQYKLSWLDVTQIVFKVRQNLKSHLHDIKPIDGLSDILGELQDQHKLHIVSSNLTENIYAWCQNYMPNVEFTSVYGTLPLLGKTSILKRFAVHHIRPAIYVGDEIRDMKAARRAKLPFVAVSWGFQHKECLQAGNPDFLIDAPAELFNILN